jgi:hypothetical protein
MPGSISIKKPTEVEILSNMVAAIYIDCDSMIFNSFEDLLAFRDALNDKLDGCVSLRNQKALGKIPVTIEERKAILGEQLARRVDAEYV